jgi:hypothetical protein
VLTKLYLFHTFLKTWFPKGLLYNVRAEIALRFSINGLNNWSIWSFGLSGLSGHLVYLVCLGEESEKCEMSETCEKRQKFDLSGLWRSLR